MYGGYYVDRGGVYIWGVCSGVWLYVEGDIYFLGGIVWFYIWIACE